MMLRGRSAGTDRKQYAREQREKRTASGLHSRAGSFAEWIRFRDGRGGSSASVLLTRRLGICLQLHNDAVELSEVYPKTLFTTRYKI
jgi:hypothetical protein